MLSHVHFKTFCFSFCPVHSTYSQQARMQMEQLHTGHFMSVGQTDVIKCLHCFLKANKPQALHTENGFPSGNFCMAA